MSLGGCILLNNIPHILAQVFFKHYRWVKAFIMCIVTPRNDSHCSIMAKSHASMAVNQAVPYDGRDTNPHPCSEKSPRLATSHRMRMEDDASMMIDWFQA